MLSTTEDTPLVGPVTDASQHIAALATAKPLALSVASAVSTITGSPCTANVPHQELYPGVEMTEREEIPGLAIDDEGTSTQAVRKTHILIVKIGHNNNSRIETKSSLLKTTNIDSEGFVVQKL